MPSLDIQQPMFNPNLLSMLLVNMNLNNEMNPNQNSGGLYNQKKTNTSQQTQQTSPSIFTLYMCKIIKFIKYKFIIKCYYFTKESRPKPIILQKIEAEASNSGENLEATCILFQI